MILSQFRSIERNFTNISTGKLIVNWSKGFKFNLRQNQSIIYNLIINLFHSNCNSFESRETTKWNSLKYFAIYLRTIKNHFNSNYLFIWCILFLMLFYLYFVSMFLCYIIFCNWHKYSEFRCIQIDCIINA